jgi:hypothetical protein
MPLQNRVLPTQEIIAHPARGTLTGNRGILHDDQRRLGTTRWRHKAWISCTLHYKGIRRTPMTPGTWTELFFLDEAVALAEGHRPCALCRRDAFRAFQAAWPNSPASAPHMDAVLHAARLDLRQQRRHTEDFGNLPGGTFILHDHRPHLVHAGNLHPYAPDGYAPPIPCPDGTVQVLTPWPLVAVLRAGYAPALHPSLT